MEVCFHGCVHRPATENRQFDTAYHIQYRSIQTKVNHVTHRRCNASFRAQRGGSAVRASELRDRLPSRLPHWKCDVRSSIKLISIEELSF